MLSYISALKIRPRGSSCRTELKLSKTTKKIMYLRSKDKYRRFRSSHPEVFVGKGVLKICSKITREHQYNALIQCICIALTLSIGTKCIEQVRINLHWCCHSISGSLFTTHARYWVYRILYSFHFLWKW